MTAAELLSKLRSLDVRIWADNGDLCCNGPQGVLTAELRQALNEQKADVLALLNRAGSPDRREPPLERIPRDGELPLSFAQQRLWFIDQLESGSALYNVATAFRIRGRLSLVLLEQSLNEIVRRHEALRTTFGVRDGRAVQKISPSLAVPFLVVDLTNRPGSEREGEALRLINEEGRRAFDLADGPLLRASVMHLAAEDHILLLTLHHIACDGWSMSILFRELSALYEAFSRGRPSPLSELPIQYVDYAVWQREWLKGEVLEKQLAYWREKLTNAPAVLDIPKDRPRPRVQTFRGSRQQVVLSETLSESLKALSRREGVTLYMTLLAAFKVMLCRYTGQVDIAVGTPILGRNRAETADLIGYFANTLVLRTDLSGDPTFRALLKRVWKVALEAYTHQELPFEKLVEALQPDRDLSYNPVFQVLFALHNIPPAVLNLSGLSIERVEVDSDTARFDLALDLREQPGGLSGWLEYSTDLFDAATINRMVGHFKTLLESIAADPDEPLSTLTFLTEIERKQLFIEWQRTSVDHRRDRCLPELFETQVDRTPEAVAVVCEDSRLTFRELNQRANRLAHYLRKLGITAEVPVGICVERSLDMVVGLLAILKAGGVYVPLDSNHPTERLAYMLEEIRAPVLLTQQELVHRIPHQPGRIVCLNGDKETIVEETDENLAPATMPENLAYIIYTSGSTGRPKGVQICHRSVFRLLETTRPLFGFGEHDVWSAFHSYGFDFSVWEIWAALLQGGRLVIVPPQVFQSPTAFIDLLRRERVTVLNQTPSAMRQLLEARRQTTDNDHDRGSTLFGAIKPEALRDLSLRLIICGGEAFPPELVSLVLEWNVPVWNFYGPTEATVWTTIHAISPTCSDADSVPIGRPIGDRQIYLLDRNLQPVPIGVPGELHIGGAGLARGYFNSSELTAEKFIPDPFNRQAGRRLYRTGDLARYLPDGTLVFLGRLDYQVKIRGFRVELGEIEAVLTQHPAVRAAVVTVREDTSPKRLVAYIVPDRQQTHTISDLHSFLKERLPDYMIPSAFVDLDAFPLNASGKVDRRALPAPEAARPKLEQTFIAPRDRIEETVAQIWSEVLQLERIGIHDNFFELGGHSLLATQVMSRLRNAVNLEVPLRSLFENPTVEEFAQRINALSCAGEKYRASVGDSAEEREEIQL